MAAPKTGWLSKAGPYPVERLEKPHLPGAVDLSKPRTGVMHTTEGGWDSALSVFNVHYAPHFMVGTDGHGKNRIVQMVPLGNMAAALINSAGGADTNTWAYAQIELVGHSQIPPWLPDIEVRRRLAALMGQLRSDCDIPLSRPFPDTLEGGVVWATESNPRRLSGKWGKEAGWFGHVEIPENEHWDPGSLQYRELFKLAGVAPIDPPPPPPPPEDQYEVWKKWYLAKPKAPRRVRRLAGQRRAWRAARPDVVKQVPTVWWRRLVDELRQ